MWFLVGLGNPGSRYEDSRHNAGFLVVDEVSRRWGLPSARAQLGALVRRGDVAGRAVLLAQPQTFMNCSGGPVGALLHFYKASMDRLVVVHDDLDLEFGSVRLKFGGGHGGHNGLRDLGAHIGLDFLRLRVGISRPPGGSDSADYVLSRWSDAERAGLDEVVAQAADAVEAVLTEGASAAMNRFNVRPRASLAQDPAQVADPNASVRASEPVVDEPAPLAAAHAGPNPSADRV